MQPSAASSLSLRTSHISLTEPKMRESGLNFGESRRNPRPMKNGLVMYAPHSGVERCLRLRANAE